MTICDVTACDLCGEPLAEWANGEPVHECSGLHSDYLGMILCNVCRVQASDEADDYFAGGE
jgi:hypothetical protein